MVIIRGTRELLDRLKLAPAEPVVASTTRLGDWYFAILRVGQRQHLLGVSEHTRLPVVLPARDATRLATVLPDAVRRMLAALGVSSADIDTECNEMGASAWAPTRSRSLLGTLNDFAFAAREHLRQEPDVELDTVALGLAEMPILTPFRGASASDETRRTLGSTQRRGLFR